MEDGVSFLRLPIAFLKSQLKFMLKIQVPGPAADLFAEKIPACTKISACTKICACTNISSTFGLNSTFLATTTFFVWLQSLAPFCQEKIKAIFWTGRHSLDMPSRGGTGRGGGGGEQEPLDVGHVGQAER